LTKLRESLSADKLTDWSIRYYIIAARQFLQFIRDRSIPMRRVQPSDVEAFLTKKHEQYCRRHGHPPKDEIEWRCARTPAIHRLLALAQGRWPPPSDIDRRVQWFLKKLRQEGRGPEMVRKQAAIVRHFLEFLQHISVPPERVSPSKIACFLKKQLRIFRRCNGQSPAYTYQWRQRHTCAVNRFLRYVQRQWPPPVPPDTELEAYKQHLAERGINRKTIFDYCMHVRIFLAFLRERGTSVESVQPKDVDAFHKVALRRHRKRKPNRVNSVDYWQMLSRRCVRGFLRFRLGEWPPDPTRSLVERFKVHLEEQHYDTRVIGRYVGVARAFLRYLESRSILVDQAQPVHVSDFLRIQFKRYHKRHGRVPAYESKWRTVFAAPVHLLLRMVDAKWPRPTQPVSPAARFQQTICDGYAHWLTEIQGLSAGTVQKNGWVVREFLSWLAEHAEVATAKALRRLTIEEVDRYLAWRFPTLRRATRVGVSSCLRSFLRYLHAAGLLVHELASAVSNPSLYLYEDIPRTFTQHQVEEVLAVARQDKSATGLRDYAMLLMLATYGMRAGEVIRLRLEDIDWRAERIRVRRSKTRIESFLPLVAPVAEAILKYLRHGRPPTDRREVFLRVRAPRGPLASAGSLATIIGRRLQEAGIVVNGRHGSHAFRFARALSLLRASVPLKWIGDVLGHVTASSTQTYLRLATEDLRRLSLEVPKRKK
jgi:site-specific recombinase XerD